MSPRPKNFRKVSGVPVSCGFVPLSEGNRETVVLHLEEYETVLLCTGCTTDGCFPSDDYPNLRFGKTEDSAGPGRFLCIGCRGRKRVC